ncbi:MAG: hypothetical protein WA182_06180 [Candidatus Sulfotelmatobacter sp.]
MTFATGKLHSVPEYESLYIFFGRTLVIGGVYGVMPSAVSVVTYALNPPEVGHG